MLQMRARSWALRDVFPDVLRGMPIAEELQDMPEKDMGPAPVVSSGRPEREPYSQESFDANAPKWAAAITAGKKTADEIIAMVESKAPMTEEQKAAVRAMTTPVQETAE